MQRLYHLPLEPNPADFSEILQEIEVSGFEKHFKVISLTNGKGNGKKPIRIKTMTAEPVSSFVRPAWTAAQLSALYERILGSTAASRIYTSDFWTPGIVGLKALSEEIAVYAFLDGKTFDIPPSIPQNAWIRAFEFTAFQVYDAIFVANQWIKDNILIAMPDAEQKVIVTGMPYDSDFVGSLWDKSYDNGADYDCVFIGGFDVMDRPEAFVELAMLCPKLSFAMISPYDPPRGTAVSPVLLESIENCDNLTVHAGKTRGERYSVLNNSRVAFDCSIDCGVTYPLLEALTYDCLPLFQNFRGFPEILNFDSRFLYRPFDLQEAASKLKELIASEAEPPQEILQFHDEALERISEVIENGR